jgi:hypothetical protein
MERNKQGCSRLLLFLHQSISASRGCPTSDHRRRTHVPIHPYPYVHVHLRVVTLARSIHRRSTATLRAWPGSTRSGWCSPATSPSGSKTTGSYVRAWVGGWVGGCIGWISVAWCTGSNQRDVRICMYPCVRQTRRKGFRRANKTGAGLYG